MVVIILLLHSRVVTFRTLWYLAKIKVIPLGCAFLKFPTRVQAQSAIGEMHNSTTMEVCS